MDTFEVRKSKSGFTAKLFRGERMCLLGFDVEEPEDDFVGFGIERRGPGDTDFTPLRNRLTFDTTQHVDGARKFSSLESPFQKFRWVDFPYDPKNGTYTYRATKMHMPSDGKLKKGKSIELDISLNPVTYDGFLDVGFTRGFASSQAFADRFKGTGNINTFGATIIPPDGKDGLEFKKAKGDVYRWLGFEAHDLIFGLLDEAVNDTDITVEAFAYDFNEPDILDRLKKLKKRLRIIIDDSHSKSSPHDAPDSPESKAAAAIEKTAGKSNVRRTHFSGLQHNKVFILRKKGKPFKVLMGSTNFTFRGLYIQANNALVFQHPEVIELMSQFFEAGFNDPANFSSTDLAKKWHVISSPQGSAYHFCFSPHSNPELSLNPIGAAIDQASSSVLFAVAFLNQAKSGAARKAIDRLMDRPVFSYGISDKSGGLKVTKPDGTVGLVSFASLAKFAPEPFKTEWGGGSGINVHHKFVVTDFCLPTAKVFTGSSNHSVSGEKGNGDHLIMIEDRKIATAYAIEAIRVFDHLHFRVQMSGTKTKKKLFLKKPIAISGEAEPWFARDYVPDSQRAGDRLLFSAEIV
jgi:phosphatidylserine/phosphatidylglycerophosphate/cardiolipin synthase-like enzyme